MTKVLSHSPEARRNRYLKISPLLINFIRNLHICFENYTWVNSCRRKPSFTNIKCFQELATVSKSMYLRGLSNCKTKLIFCYVLKYPLPPKGFFSIHITFRAREQLFVYTYHPVTLGQLN